MPFNSNSYYRNKYRREALSYLEQARNVKRLNPGRAQDDLRHCVRLARSSWRSYLSYKRIGECDADLKERLYGNMSHSDFMAKWGTDNGRS
jgi:hypothetical protein